jgi:hypothetical protein
LLAPVFVDAQTSFPGFIITSSGDTVKGHIHNYKQSAIAPKKIEFVASGSEKKQELTPENVSLISIDGFDTYHSYTGRRLTNPIDPQAAHNALRDSSDQYENVHAFLRRIGEAKGVSIWMLADQKRTNFFSQVNNGPLEELYYKAYIDGGEFKQQAGYKQQMFNLFLGKYDQNKLMNLSSSLHYAEDRYEKFLNRVQSKKSVGTKSEAAGLFLAGGLAMNNFKIKYSIDLTSNLNTKPFNSQVTPVFNIGYFLPTGRNFNRFFLLPEIRFYKFEHTGTNKVRQSDVTFKTSMVIAPSLSIGYFLMNMSSARIFIAPGFSFLKLQNNRQELTGNLPDIAKEPAGAYTAIVQAGAILKRRFVVLGKYSFPVSVTNAAYYGAMHSSMQVVAGYKF